MAQARERIEYVQFARGFAILAIVLFHYVRRVDLSPWLAKSVELGGSAVHLFFFLSGFGLALSYTAYNSSFYTKRFISILVPYYFFVTLVLLITFVTPLYSADNWLAYLGHVFLFKMFDNRLIGTYGGHLWFVSTIVEFYILFPLLFASMRVLGTRLFLIAGLLLSVAYWLTLYGYALSSQYVYKDFFLQFFWEFALGMVFADLAKRRGFRFWEMRTWILSATLAASVLGLSVLHFRGGAIGNVFNDIPVSIAYLAVSILGYRLICNYGPLVLRPVLSLGRLSYSLYLVHMLCFALVMYVLNVQAPRMMHVLVATAVALASAYLFGIVSGYIQSVLEKRIIATRFMHLASDTL